MPQQNQPKLFKLVNASGMEVAITDYGARIVSVVVPDRNGKLADVIVGFSDPALFLGKNPYFGAIIGRYANRIAKGRFTLNGTAYSLATNGGPNSLHGGAEGFDRKFWTVSVPPRNGSRLELAYRSPDGEEGYPGNLSVEVAYTLTGENSLYIDYAAATDRDTVVNLTNHAYFNLSAANSDNILSTEITLNAGRFTPIDGALIPTGEIRAVDGTPLDFRKPVTIGERIGQDYDQLKLAGGCDHNYVLDRAGTGVEFAARAHDPATGRVLEVWTTEPGIQFYSGNFLDGSLVGKSGKAVSRRSAFCLETQHFPDSPNHPNFPSTLLRAGEQYRQSTVLKFSAAG